MHNKLDVGQLFFLWAFCVSIGKGVAQPEGHEAMGKATFSRQFYLYSAMLRNILELGNISEPHGMSLL